MAWWQYVAVVLIIAAVVAIVVVAYLIGREAGETAAAGNNDDPDGRSLFGDDVPVRTLERGLVDAMPDSMIMCEASGHVRYASPGARVFGLVGRDRLILDEIGEILRLGVGDGQTREREIQLPVDPRSRRERADAMTGRGVQAGKPVPSDTLYLRVRIGEVADGLYAVFLADMSEQRRFEAMRRDFVTNVSHELKTPAGAISLLAETISDAADDPDAVRYFSGRVAKESGRLTELVHRLIDLQKAQSMDGMVASEPVSTMGVVRAAIGENQVQADAKHIDIRLTFAGKPVPLAAGEGGAAPEGPDVTVMADAESLKTAVKNLVENAIHYSPEHTVVGVGVAQRDGKVTIRVVDQGIGIPQASLGRVFERFYRVDPARSRATGGSGLGLAITKHCVQECGGTISVWSREGEGSTFTIELPARESGAESGTASGAESGTETNPA